MSPYHRTATGPSLIRIGSRWGLGITGRTSYEAESSFASDLHCSLAGPVTAQSGHARAPLGSKQVAALREEERDASGRVRGGRVQKRARAEPPARRLSKKSPNLFVAGAWVVSNRGSSPRASSPSRVMGAT